MDKELIPSLKNISLILQKKDPVNHRFNTFASGLSLSSNEPSSSGPRENKASKQNVETEI